MFVTDTATHCNALQHTATHRNTHCNTLQHTTTHCNTQECSSIVSFLHYNAQDTPPPSLATDIATHCNTLQHTATNRSARQFVNRESSGFPEGHLRYVDGLPHRLCRHQGIFHVLQLCCSCVAAVLQCVSAVFRTACAAIKIYSHVLQLCCSCVAAVLHTSCGEVGGWGRDPKKCTGRDWGMGSSTI